jgi:hypothetical protein
MKNAKCKLQMQNEKERKGNGEIQNIKWKMQKVQGAKYLCWDAPVMRCCGPKKKS